jgi:ornithine carbamoyltransferase
MKRDLVSFSIFSAGEIEDLFTLCRRLKDPENKSFRPLQGKTAAMIFEKQSLRTRVSFEVGILQLGGQAMFLSQQNIGVSTREPVRDIAEVLSRYNDLIIARTMEHSTVEALAKYSSIPVINALTNLLHPCQVLADAYTLVERDMFTPKTKIAFIGDGNNVVNSWIELAEKLPLHFVLACPAGYEPDQAILRRAQAAGKSRIEITPDVHEAARGASVLYTDVWVSMGQEAELERRKNTFRGYQINQSLLKIADPGCVVMHCLPAHREEEISTEVLEGPQSIVLDQAENRLHIQKGIIAYLFGAVPQRAGKRIEHAESLA